MKQSFKEWSRRALAAVLTVAMALGMVPATALADELDLLVDDIPVEVQATYNISSHPHLALGDTVTFGNNNRYYRPNNPAEGNNNRTQATAGTYKLAYVSSSGSTHTFSFTSTSNSDTKFTITIEDNTETDLTQIAGVGVYNSNGWYTDGSQNDPYRFQVLWANKSYVSVSGIAAQNKVYDGTTAATLDFGTGTITNVAEGDDVSIDQNSLTGKFEDANVGEDKVVNFSLTSRSLKGEDAYKYDIDYSLSQSSTTASITARPVTITAKAKDATINGAMPADQTVDDKVSVSNTTTNSGIVNGQTLTDVTVTYDPADTSTAKADGTVTPSAAKIEDGEGNNVTTNYAITYTANTFRVDSVPTVVVEPAEGLVYNGRGNANAQTLIKEDTATTDFGTLEYAVTTSATTAPRDRDYSTSLPKGDEADTYYVWWRVREGVDTTNNTSWDAAACEQPLEVTIAQKPVTFKGIQGRERVYDGTTAVVIETTSGSTVSSANQYRNVLDGVLSSDSDYVTVNPGQTNYADKNVGTDKEIEFTDFSLARAGGNQYRTVYQNYKLVVPSGENAVKGTITKRDAWVTGLKGVNKVYDATKDAEVQKDSENFAVGNKVDGDDLDIDLDKTTAKFADANVDTDIKVTFTPALKGADVDNYNLVVTKGQTTTTADITVRPVTVKATDYKAFWKRDMPDLDSMTAAEKATLEKGQKGDETFATIDGHVIDAVDITFDPNNTDNVKLNGTATPDNVKIKDADNNNVTDNYDITYADGAFVVKKKNEAQVDAIEGLVYTKTAQKLVSVEKEPLNGGKIKYWMTTDASAKPDDTTTWSEDIPTGTDAGTYYVWWGVEEDDEYFELMSDDAIKVTVAPKTVGLSWTGTKLTYDGTEQAPKAKATGLEDGDACDVTVTGAKKDAGNYVATATKLSNANYKLPANVTCEFTIVPREVGLSWSGTKLTYNGKKQAPTAKATGLVEGDECDVTVTGEKKNVGNYTATAKSLSNKNYKLPGTNTAKFTIAKAKLTVTAKDKSIKFGAKAANAGVKYTGLQGSDTAKSLSGKLKYSYGGYKKGSKAGKYKITPSGLKSGNYTITYKKGTLTVKAPGSVAAKGQVRVDGKGWVKTGKNGVFGTTGQSLRTTGIKIGLASLPYSGGIRYKGHFQDKGWQTYWTLGDAKCAVKDKRLEAVQIELTGKMAKKYDVWYRVHTQKLGWMAWAKNGDPAGTTSASDRLEAVQVVVKKAGSKAPSKNYNDIRQTYPKAFTTKVA